MSYGLKKAEAGQQHSQQYSQPGSDGTWVGKGGVVLQINLCSNLLTS